MADKELATINTGGGLTAIQLGDVTADKKVLTQDEIDAKIVAVNTNVENVTFVPQGALPAYVEGKLWYDDTRKCLAFYDDVTTDPIHISQEMLSHVYNNTGTTLLAGQVVRYSGQIVNGLPAVVLAQADTLQNSKVFGIVSNDMPTATSGSIVSDGVISGIDTSAYAQGQRMYLSDTVAGGLTATPPDIICHVGGALESAVDGSFYVSVDNYQTLPTALANLEGGSAGTDITTTWTDITGYTDKTEIIMTANETTGEILAPVGGSYGVYINVVVTFDDIGASSELLYMRLVGDLGFVGTEVPFSIARNGEGASMYPSITGTLTAGENYKLQISASTTLTNVTYNFIAFELEAKKLVP